MSETKVFKTAHDITNFTEQRYQAHFASSANWIDAHIRAFRDLKDHTTASDLNIEASRHRKMIDLAFTVRGVEGARMISEIPDTSKTRAFETVFGDGTTYFHKAVSQEGPIMLQAMINRLNRTGDVRPEFIHTQDNAGNSPLHTLARHSANLGIGTGKDFADREEMARMLIVDAGINTSLRDGVDRNGQTASEVLSKLATKNEHRKTLHQSREPWETDQYLDAIIDDAKSMQQSIARIKMSGGENPHRVQRTGTYDEGHMAEIIDLASRRGGR